MTQQSSPSDKRALLAQLLQQKRQAYSYPLSYGQQALWFIYQNAPDSPAYNMAKPIEIHGNLNLTSLQQVLQALVNRHLVLQTTIELVDGEPMQTVQPTGAYHWNEHQAVEWSEQQLGAAIKTAYEQPFDLTHGPVLRADLFQTAPQRYILLLTMHHIFGDASSMNILGNELLALYQAELSGKKANIPSISNSYTDFVRAETAMLNSPTGEELAQYWQHRLGNESPILNLPTDYPRPAVQSYNGASVPFCLPAKLSQQIKQLAQQEKSTLFSLLLTAFQTLLHRYTGQTEIWIGAPTSTSRRQTQFANLIGYLVNPVVLRATIDPATKLSFRELLSQTKQTVLEAIEHSAYPFPLLVKTLQPQRDSSYAPLFQVMLDFQAAESLALKPNMTELKVSALELAQMEGQFDLALNISEGEPLRGSFKYNRDLFKSETIERMVNHFQILLTAIVDNPAQSISHLPMLTEMEIKQLQAWNDTATDYPIDQTIINLFEQQVEKTPDNIAVVFEEQSVSYWQLNEKANQLAHHLLMLKTQAGISSPNPLIAIMVERSLEMVIGLLGILKAGGAYVPIDPSYPVARIQYMLEDSAAPLLVTQSSMKAQLSLDELECVVVCLDEMDTGNLPSENPLVNRQATDLAYVIYTSGSTGKPKGVMVEQRHLVNSIQARNNYYRYNQAKFLLLTSFAFDSSVAGIFGSLSAGWELYLSNSTNDLLELSLLIRQHGISHLLCVPTLYMALLEYSNDTLYTLNTVIVAGESSKANLIQQHDNKTYQARLFNEYGPTEGTVWSSVYEYQRVDDLIDNIGQPIANTRIYILDAQHHPLPPSIPGELCIAGAGVARGYLNRPELTAEKFIQVVIEGKTERIYKTGDLAKWREDGNLEYLGRIDHQVKLRGFRIELGEIEFVLSQIPNLKESVVVIRETDSDQKQLVAYVVTEKQDAQEAETALKFKEYLKQKLPDYMVPAFFVFIEALPLTPNGKIDRKALPEPVIRNSGLFVSPRDAVELRLVQLWEKLFGISPVSVLDNFFDIGGDSLLAIRLFANIKQEFSLTVPLHTIFQNRTVEQLACILRQDAVPLTGSPLVCLQSQGSKSPLFFVHAAGGSAFNYFQIATLMGTERPFYALQPRGIEPGEPFHDSIEEMAADYVATVRSVQPKGPYLLAGWSFGGTVIFEMARILEQAGETVPFLLMIDVPSPFIVPDEKDDLEFLLDRLPHWDRLALDELDLQNSREAQLAYLFKEIKLAGLFTLDIDQAYVLHWLNLYKHHTLILGPYLPSAPFNGRIIFFKPSEKIPFDVQMGKPIPGWKPFARGGLEVHEAPGNHFNMISPVNAPVLVKMMKECIEGFGLLTDNRLLGDNYVKSH
jgi:amino acid adenylation domain-containing protein